MSTLLMAQAQKKYDYSLLVTMKIDIFCIQQLIGSTPPRTYILTWNTLRLWATTFNRKVIAEVTWREANSKQKSGSD